MKKMVFITTADAEYGFLLGGAPQVIAERPQADDALSSALIDPDMGLVIVDERLLAPKAGETAEEGISPERLRRVEQDWEGVLLVLPAPERPQEAAEDYATRLIRRAIGYHVRINL